MLNFIVSDKLILCNKVIIKKCIISIFLINELYPVVGIGVGIWITAGPDVVVGVYSIFHLTLLEPLVHLSRVIRDEVHDQPHLIRNEEK